MPNLRNPAGHTGPVLPSGVWTKTSTGERFQTNPQTGLVERLPDPNVQDTWWDKTRRWVENDLPGGWWTAAGAAGVLLYLILVPPPAPPPRRRQRQDES